jgi:hypothetical protein
MIKMQRKALHIFSLIVLNAVHVIFFTVQICFNFETPNRSKFSSLDNSGVFSVKNASHPSSKTYFRLNKRFQPKGILLCNFINTNASDKFISVSTLLSCPPKFLPAFALVNHPLRGPPIGA